MRMPRASISDTHTHTHRVIIGSAMQRWERRHGFSYCVFFHSDAPFFSFSNACIQGETLKKALTFFLSNYSVVLFVSQASGTLKYDFFMNSKSFNSISKVKNELLCIKKMNFGRRLCLIQFKLNSLSREFNRSWNFSALHCVTGCSNLFCYKELQNSTFGNIPHLVMCKYNRNGFCLHWQWSTTIITNPYLNELLDVFWACWVSETCRRQRWYILIPP